MRALLADGLADPRARRASACARTPTAGSPAPTIFTLGALRRGELWESVAVPELREQAAAIAEAIRSQAAERSPLAVAI